jgi:hypothetical protein
MAKQFLSGIDATNQRIVNVGSPSSATDASNKAYVDNALAGLQWKPGVRAATTASGNLATAYASGQVLDGVTLATGDRILIKDQSNGAENGLYVVAASGTPARATDADGAGELTPNATVFVAEGSVNADRAYTVTTNGTITIGTTATVWARFGGGTTYTAGNGLSLNSTTFAVNNGAGIVADGTSTRIDTSVVVTKYAATIGDGSATSITVTHGLGTRDVTVGVYDAASYVEYECDVTHTTLTAITLSFATAPAASSLRVVVHG